MTATVDQSLELPISLPDGWLAEHYRNDIAITAVVDGDNKGAVTVSTKVRGFELGFCPVRKAGAYAGRGWQAALYGDAVKALQEAILPVRSDAQR